MPLIRTLILTAALLIATPALAEDATKQPEFSAVLKSIKTPDGKPLHQITLKDHQFTPVEIKVKANEAFVVEVKNEDSSAEEFESEELEIEKVIAGNATSVINIPALEPGTYHFVGEYNEKTAKGTIIAE